MGFEGGNAMLRSLAALVLLTLAAPAQTPAKTAAAADFPESAHYREANRDVLRVNRRVRVVFFGDSILEYWGLHAGTWFVNPGWLNRGIGGQTTAQLLLRENDDVLKLHPGAVFLEGGSNDMRLGFSPEEVRDRFESMGELAHAHHIAVFVATMTPTCDCVSQVTGLRTVERIHELNNLLETMCRRHGWALVNLNTPLSDPTGHMRRELTVDGVHLNDQGYAMIAPIVEKALVRFH
jgi:lysophospholipase L1-like esterase